MNGINIDAKEKLADFVERIENLESEKKILADDIKVIYDRSQKRGASYKNS